jgi:hypothetical protein
MATDGYRQARIAHGIDDAARLSSNTSPTSSGQRSCSRSFYEKVSAGISDREVLV